MLSFLPILTVALLSAVKMDKCSALLVVPTASSTTGGILRVGCSSETRARTNKVRLDAVREATFGMGCFWEPSESMLKVEGVLDTVVGYAGGSLGGSNLKPLQAPTYDDVCYGEAWVEAVRVAYDDEIITYETLLDAFFVAQKPDTDTGNRQYASIIFPSNEIQNEAAERWLCTAKDMGRQRPSDNLAVSVVGIEYNNKNSSGDNGVLFYRAEDYHQEYWQKWRPRYAVAVVLLSTASGLLAPIFSATVGAEESQLLERSATTILLVAAFYYGIVERQIGHSVRELLPGTFAESADMVRNAE